MKAGRRTPTSSSEAWYNVRAVQVVLGQLVSKGGFYLVSKRTGSAVSWNPVLVCTVRLHILTKRGSLGGRGQ
jgi:hypothetical protein